ncbi:hypothetical protein [Kitasatospora brasiliensis]|uniref:hypothetical protein n=1 Tax=Kitasatospora brasiliensis TaxID=3058040 RepID=UPI00292D48DC|nr:hypothetical protein [Kitasatospora sp. K002]
MNVTLTPSVELAELGRFFRIAVRRIDAGEAGPEMFSGAVDAAWHRLVADPVAHEAFAFRHAGRRLVHVEGSGAGFVSWVGAYEEAYGPLPEVWFTDADGTVDTAALARYRETGEVWAEWNCGPVEGDDGDDLVPASHR